MSTHIYNVASRGGDVRLFPEVSGWAVNELRIMQAQTIHHHSHMYGADFRPIELAQLLNPLYDASHKRNKKIAPPDSQCLVGTRGSLLDELRSWVQTGTMEEDGVWSMDEEWSTDDESYMYDEDTDSEPDVDMKSLANVDRKPEAEREPEENRKPDTDRILGTDRKSDTERKPDTEGKPDTDRILGTDRKSDTERKPDTEGKPDLRRELAMGGQSPPLKKGRRLGKPICWMYGSFGCGKSAIAQTMAEEFGRRRRLAASFFFFRNSGDRSNVTRFANTLAHQIALNIPGAKELIERAITQDPGLSQSTCSLETQFEQLVFEPLLACLGRPSGSEDDPYLIVTDGLDECEDKEGISQFLDLVIAFFSGNPGIPLRLFITSRVEEHILSHVEDGQEVIKLVDLTVRSSWLDIKTFMQVFFADARKRNRALQALPSIWPTEQDLDKLVKYCDGSFIFGSTLAKFIIVGSGDRDPRTPMERLPLAIDISPGIDAIYTTIISQAQHLSHSLSVVSTIAYLETPLSIPTISALLGLSTYDVLRILLLLQAILHVPGRDDLPVTFFHTSLRDFLMDKNRSGALHSPGHHTFLADRCLEVLFGSEPTDNVKCNKYAVINWPTHLNKAALMKEGDLFGESTSTFHCNDPYRPINIGEWEKREFRSRRGEQRPVRIMMSQREDQIISNNLRQLGITLGLSVPPEPRPEQSDIMRVLMRGSYHGRYPFVEVVEGNEHMLPRWSGAIKSRSKLESRHICSLKDIVEGLCVWTASPAVSSGLELSMKRGDGVFITLSKNDGRWETRALKEETAILYKIRTHRDASNGLSTPGPA